MKPETLTEDQRYCADMLAEWVRGYHHLPAVKTFGAGVCVNMPGGLSTFDFDRLTTLVLLAHLRFVRIEIASSGPRLVKVIAHRRAPKTAGMHIWQFHPSLDDLRLQINQLAPLSA